jgi:hypothetical protein
MNLSEEACRCCGIPTTDLIVFAATRDVEQKGEERGGLGLFIGGE